ncbi:MAG: hypothetical protein EA349_14475 [Halomonadaceae bacterium]|nr:MAG: hypothetical protein EA349_14475 [Halomonadaceae bacterium]
MESLRFIVPASLIPYLMLLVLVFLPGTVVQAGTTYSLENFPDGDQRLEELLAGDKEKQPYFVWRDAEGRLHNTPYHGEDKKVSAAAPTETESRWSSALDIIRRQQSAQPSDIQPDPKALELMGLPATGDHLADFSSDCCLQLSMSNRRPLPLDRGQGVTVSQDTPNHVFATGTSPYILLALPQDAHPWALRLRTFIDKGAFIPTLVFLDQHRQPVRMVTDIKFRFKPARWHRLGYLEAVLPMAQEQPEQSAYVLVVTREQDLSAQTLVQHEGDDAVEMIRLNNLPKGELELKLFSR